MAIPIFGICYERDQRKSSMGNLSDSDSALLSASWLASNTVLACTPNDFHTIMTWQLAAYQGCCYILTEK